MNRLDTWTGLVFVFFGVLALVLGPVERGDATHMAAGYFPAMIGALLSIVGIVLIIKGARHRVAGRGAWRPSLRAFLIFPAIVAFALLFERAGLVAASFALLTIGAFAARDLTLRQFVSVAAVLITLALLIFVWGLGLPVKVWPV